jgi:hypothetical protein
MAGAAILIVGLTLIPLGNRPAWFKSLPSQ